MISKINGKLFADMIIQGAQNLSNNADLVDSLNVYPVPDLSLIHISEPTRLYPKSRMPSSA